MTTSLTLRSEKGSALTHAEGDANLTALRTTADAALAASDTLTADKAEAAALGVANTDQNMGSFTGTTISDNVSAKVGMQELETAVETKANATAVGVTSSAANMGTYTGTTIPDNETAKQNIQSLETAVETKANASAVGVTSSAADMGTFTGTTIPDSQTAKQALQALETAHEATSPFSHSTSYSSGTVGKTLQQRAYVITDAPFSAPTDGATDIAPYIEAGVSALSSVDDFLLIYPAGDFVIATELLFTDKNITLRGAGEGLTRIHYTTSSSSIKHLDTSTTTGWNVHSQFNASDFTVVVDYTTSATTGAPVFDIVGSYTGIIASWHHGSIKNVTIQGQSATKYFNKGIRLTDVGQFQIDSVRGDNGGAQASNATSFIEIKRSAASNITSFPITNCFCYGYKYGILLTHASATQAGTIEALWCQNNEFVGVRHAIYDDNQGTGNTTKTLNAIDWIGGFSSYSYSFAKLGYVTNLRAEPNYTIASNLVDTGAALEAAIEVTTYIEEASIGGGRWLRSGSMDAASAIILPTRDNCKRVKIQNTSFNAWDAVVDQVGTATVDRNRILVSGVQHDSVPLSTTGSGYEERGWKALHSSAVAIAHTGDTAEYTAITKSILGGSMGPNGRLRVTFIMSTATSTANSKTVRVKLGSTTMFARAETTGLIGQYRAEICNRNSQSSQIVNQASSGGWGFSGGTPVTATEDTSGSLNLLITLQLANSGETITLESYLIEALYGE